MNSCRGRRRIQSALGFILTSLMALLEPIQAGASHATLKRPSPIPFVKPGPLGIPITHSAALKLRAGATYDLTRRRADRSAKVAAVSKASADQTQAEKEESQQTKILLLIKVMFLCYYASLGSLLPYLPVYYHSLGHGGLIIGMLGAVKPLTTFLVAPFWGILSDGTGNRFRILYFTFLVSVVTQLLVAFRNDVSYLIAMVFITAFFNAPVKSLIDSLVMDNIPDKRQYGRLRLWGQLGFGIGSSGVGMLLHKSKGVVDDVIPPYFEYPLVRQMYAFWQNLVGYRLLFLAYASLSIPTWLCLRSFERRENEKQQTKKVVVVKKVKKGKVIVETKPQGAHIKRGLQLLIQNGDALLFFFLVFIVGVSSGIIENFAYVRMREVGGTGKEMGLSRLVSSCAGAPMFWFSGPLTEALGVDRVLAFSLLSYVVRFFIYAFMRNPYEGLPAEALRGVTFAAFWSTGTIYAHRISPPGMGATMVSVD